MRATTKLGSGQQADRPNASVRTARTITQSAPAPRADHTFELAAPVVSANTDAVDHFPGIGQGFVPIENFHDLFS